MPAAEIERMTDGLESGPPSAKGKELRKESARMAMQLPTMAVQTPRLMDDESAPPKMSAAKELA
jgi:hypothetical protein